MPLKTDAVVFDMDGILFDSERMVVECWKEIADRHGMQNVEKVCRSCTGLNEAAGRAKFLEYYGKDLPYMEYRKEMSALFHGRYDGGRLPLKKGVHELMRFLKENGVRISLASSTRSEVVHQELTDAGLISYFDAVICGDMIEKSKPAPDIFLKACSQLQVKPQAAYGIEDSYNGIRALHAAGMHPVMVPDLLEPDAEMRQLAEVILPSLVEVKNYLEN
ncbi:MAG: HAD family phosphatase [Butyrivibrio sp.]|jgi:HAD superfamily hydrolase (TIGR01509 family)|nr:HAD family phosphatase [Butyrivibrio sp.]